MSDDRIKISIKDSTESYEIETVEDSDLCNFNYDGYHVEIAIEDLPGLIKFFEKANEILNG